MTNLVSLRELQRGSMSKAQKQNAAHVNATAARDSTIYTRPNPKRPAPRSPPPPPTKRNTRVARNVSPSENVDWISLNMSNDVAVISMKRSVFIFLMVLLGSLLTLVLVSSKSMFYRALFD